MPDDPQPDTSPSSLSPPRAFTQGVGTVFQFTGVTLFLVLMFVCCASGLLSPRTAIRKDLSNVGWPHDVEPGATAAYSVPKAMTVSLAFGVFCGIALAGLGLGHDLRHLSGKSRFSSDLSRLEKTRTEYSARMGLLDVRIRAVLCRYS